MMHEVKVSYDLHGLEKKTTYTASQPNVCNALFFAAYGT